LTSPFVVTVLGLKKSGKTSVVEGIVAELRRRGFSTGTVKSMVHSAFSFDVKGKDTYRHVEAGAEFVISLSRDQTVYLERNGEGQRDLGAISRLFPGGAQFVVCEGFEGKGSACQVLALREPGDLKATMEVRSVDPGSVIAVSGLVASRERSVEGIRAYDIMDPGERASLVELIVMKAGNPKPSGEMGGPLIDDPTWRPGVLPPGEYPGVPDLGHGEGSG